MAELKTLTVQKREELGKGFNRRLRQNDTVPGVYYSASGANMAVQVLVEQRPKPRRPICPASFIR